MISKDWTNWQIVPGENQIKSISSIMGKNRNMLDQIKLFSQCLELCCMGVSGIVYPVVEITKNTMF